jgi:hypothetical protein
MELMGDVRLALWDATELDQIQPIIEGFVERFEKFGYLEKDKLDLDPIIGPILDSLETAFSAEPSVQEAQ